MTDRRHATAAEILAATASTQDTDVSKKCKKADVIEIGDTVCDDQGRRTVVDALYDTCVHGFEEDKVPCTATGWTIMRSACRLVSKGKKGQGEPGVQATGDANKTPRTTSQALGTARSSETAISPCPACSGTGVQPGFGDETIACGRCQFGKPAPEPEPVRPYHVTREDDSIVLHEVKQNMYRVVIECPDCGKSTQDWEIADGKPGECYDIVCSDCHEMRYEQSAEAARQALAAAKAECKRLGVSDA